jgi:hypothetical protein
MFEGYNTTPTSKINPNNPDTYHFPILLQLVEGEHPDELIVVLSSTRAAIEELTPSPQLNLGKV